MTALYFPTHHHDRVVTVFAAAMYPGLNPRDAREAAILHLGERWNIWPDSIPVNERDD
jgi:hypothetical protein